MAAVKLVDMKVQDLIAQGPRLPAHAPAHAREHPPVTSGPATSAMSLAAAV